MWKYLVMVVSGIVLGWRGEILQLLGRRRFSLQQKKAPWHTRLMTDELDMHGVVKVLSWAVDQLHAPTALLYMSLYEQHSGTKFDVSEATLVT